MHRSKSVKIFLDPLHFDYAKDICEQVKSLETLYNVGIRTGSMFSAFSKYKSILVAEMKNALNCHEDTSEMILFEFETGRELTSFFIYEISGSRTELTEFLRLNVSKSIAKDNFHLSPEILSKIRHLCKMVLETMRSKAVDVLKKKLDERIPNAKNPLTKTFSHDIAKLYPFFAREARSIFASTGFLAWDEPIAILEEISEGARILSDTCLETMTASAPYYKRGSCDNILRAGKDNF